MTIVETERVSAPDIERRDAREERARILEAAALEIEVRGWAQVSLKRSDGSICLVGAVAHALGGVGGMTLMVDGIAVSVHRAAEMVFSGRPRDEIVFADLQRLWRFNDCDARTAAEVTFLLRWRASEIRDGR